MTNTWDYKFAFDIETGQDVPPEFQSSFARCVDSYGSPVLGLFSPAVEQSRFIFSNWFPPRLILLFSECLVVLSLDVKSDKVHSLEWSPNELAGYGQADFLLNCWFALYADPVEGAKTIIRFPSRAAARFSQLSSALWRWCGVGGEELATVTRPLTEISGLPKKFSTVLEDKLGVWCPTDFFYQPTLEVCGRTKGRWANLLLMTGARGIFVLSDECRGESSVYGFEFTHFPIQRVQGVEWIDPRPGGSASIRIRLRGAKGEITLAWQVFGGLKPYALPWSHKADSLAKSLNHEYSRS